MSVGLHLTYEEFRREAKLPRGARLPDIRDAAQEMANAKRRVITITEIPVDRQSSQDGVMRGRRKRVTLVSAPSQRSQASPARDLPSKSVRKGWATNGGRNKREGYAPRPLHFDK